MPDYAILVLDVVVQRAIDISDTALQQRRKPNPMIMEGRTNWFGKGRTSASSEALIMLAAPVTVFATIRVARSV